MTNEERAAKDANEIADILKIDGIRHNGKNYFSDKAVVAALAKRAEQLNRDLLEDMRKMLL